MKPMNSDTHSCIASFASFAIFAFPGSAFFMILQQQQQQQRQHHHTNKINSISTMTVAAAT
jgi:preprotein translocase subunit YajC